MEKDDEVKRVVFEILRRNLQTPTFWEWIFKKKSPKVKIRMSDRLIQDLNLGTDEFEIISELQNRLAVKATRVEWRKVRTVGELISLLRSKVQK